MAAPSRRSSSGPVLRSLSPSGRFHSSPSASSSAFASYSSSFSSTFHRSASPTRVNLYGTSPSAPTVRWSLDRPISPNRSISVTPRGTPTSPHHHHHHQVVKRQATSATKRTCMCSPTTHPGSFRCSLHKNCGNSQTVSYSSNRLNARRSAMTNSLVRIVGVEGTDSVKRALAALIRPSSHQQRRRAGFQRRPSRLSIMSKAEEWR